jgi:hypothetical protein
MLRKIGLAVAYFVAGVYVLSIVLPALYCLQHGCTGPELDGFMPAFMFTPAGTIATVFALRHSIQQIRKKQPWSWAFWPLAVIFVAVLAGVAALLAIGIYQTAFRR